MNTTFKLLKDQLPMSAVGRAIDSLDLTVYVPKQLSMNSCQYVFDKVQTPQF